MFGDSGDNEISELAMSKKIGVNYSLRIGSTIRIGNESNSCGMKLRPYGINVSAVCRYGRAHPGECCIDVRVIIRLLT